MSVTVSVTLFAPEFPQLKLVGLMIVVAMVQLSFEPLFTWEVTIETVPPLFNCTVRFWQIAFGRIVSNTVTIPLQVLEFPL